MIRCRPIGAGSYSPEWVEGEFSQRVACRLSLTDTCWHESVLQGTQAEGVGRRGPWHQSQGGRRGLRRLVALHKALAEDEEGERRHRATSHSRSSGSSSIPRRFTADLSPPPTMRPYESTNLP